MKNFYNFSGSAKRFAALILEVFQFSIQNRQGYLPGLIIQKKEKNHPNDHYYPFPSVLGYLILFSILLPNHRYFEPVKLVHATKLSQHFPPSPAHERRLKNILPFFSTTICSNTTLSITLQYVSANSPDPKQGPGLGGTTPSFRWVATDNPSVTGESTTQQTNPTINNTLTNTSGSNQTVTYTVTDPNNQTYTETVIVKPEPSYSNATTPTCSRVALNYTLDVQQNGIPDQPLETPPVGVGFSWVATSNVNVSGESTSSQTGPKLIDNLINTTPSDQYVIYTVTPTGANGCVGQTFTVTVTVKPEPVYSNATISTCSGVTLDYGFVTQSVGTIDTGQPQNGIPGPTFSWVATSNANVSGESTSAQSGNKLTNKLINTTDYNEQVVYTVTPTGANGCIGTAFTVTVTVKPEPVFTNATTSTCSGTALDYALDNFPLPPSIAALSSHTFSWVAVSNANVGGESSTPQTGDKLTDNLTNSTLNNELVTYIITPTSLDACVGDTFTVEVTVKPAFVCQNATTETCSNVALDYDLVPSLNLFFPNIKIAADPANTFTWVATANSYVSG